MNKLVTKKKKRKYYIPEYILVLGFIFLLLISFMPYFIFRPENKNFAIVYIPKSVPLETAPMSENIISTPIIEPETISASPNIKMEIVDAPVLTMQIVESSLSFLSSDSSFIKVYVSHYVPWLGGTNCSNFQNGVCISHLANGQSWQNWVDKGAACVPEWQFGTKFRLQDGNIWTCVDRGGGIKIINGIAWVDLLTAHTDYKYGSIQDAEIIR